MGSTLKRVSSRVNATSSIKNPIPIMKRRVLNFASHHKFIKNEATINDFTTAIATATITFQGPGICIQVTAMVIKVKMNRAIATPQRNLADDI